MRIETYILCNNEEIMLPYLMRHYSQFSDVIILESRSTDNTVQMAHKLGAEVWTYDWPDELNDELITDVKNNCWRESKADWIMIVDADEFIYHQDITKDLSESRYTVIRPRFFDMYSDKFPTTKKQIYDEVQYGIEQLSPSPKMNIFRMSAIKEMKYAPGCHDADPQGLVSIDNDSEVKTLHMRYLGKEFVYERNKRHAQRRSQVNKDRGWGWHVDKSREIIEAEFDANFKNVIKVI